MKKLCMICIALSLWASGTQTLKLKAQLLDLIATFLNNGHSGALLYIDDPSYKEVAQFLKRSSIVDNCEKATIIFTKHFVHIDPKCKDKELFFLSFKEYKKHKTEAVGAFFWQKGRPNILFRKEMLQRLHIRITPEFEKYVE